MLCCVCQEVDRVYSHNGPENEDGKSQNTSADAFSEF